MPRRRWIKLWTQETLYGTTSAELELDEQALWFKLLALAGDSPEPGKVEIAPGIAMTDEQISGILKAPLDTWLRTKEKLRHLDIDKIFINEGIIYIRNWERYQSEYERTKKYRGTIFPKEDATQKSTPEAKVENSVEKLQENVSSIPDQTRPNQKDIITTTAREENLAKIAKLYEDNIGRLTSVIGERLKDIADKYPAGWFEEALKEAVELEHRNLKYIEAILERWHTEGFKAPKRTEGGRGEQPRKRPQQERKRPLKYIRGSGEPRPEDTEDMP